MPESSRVAHQNQEGGHLHSGGDDAAEAGGTVDSLYLKQHHLKEFYKKQQQINTQLLQQQPAKKSKELLAQQLALQQLLHIQQHLHFQHQQSVCSSAANISSVESKHVWKEMTAEEEDENTKCDHNGADKKKTIDERQTRDLLSCCPQNCSSEADLTTINVLYGHGVCNWPGCESICQNYSKFVKHMHCEHTLDDRSAAQCRVQMQVVHQLEIQLLKERERLRAMTAHLQLTPTAESNSAPTGSHLTPRDTSVDPLCPQSSSVTCNSPSLSPPHLLAPVAAPLQEGPPRTSCAGAMRHRHHRLAYSSEKEHDLSKNADIRPPFTYATLIRQAILESADTELTLNEIYTWFTRTFAFFRRNAATWKAGKNVVFKNNTVHVTCSGSECCAPQPELAQMLRARGERERRRVDGGRGGIPAAEIPEDGGESTIDGPRVRFERQLTDDIYRRSIAGFQVRQWKKFGVARTTVSFEHVTHSPSRIRDGKQWRSAT
ncbi:forkhead box protein P2-like isoform X3 [Phycodurus eques]|uniref:forkhead box protein P2-like isoform X3 n=1 Tax=Phycodurus eques TaxID=693459 RepID=UPI002ACEBE3F|nr:forkhead box protein P2-like isoform X3 [Phycodurus eques]